MQGIQEIGTNRIESLKFEHILICTKETAETEIKSFIERALRDPNNEYVMLAYQNLDRKKQQFVVDEIVAFKRTLSSPEDFKLKLCLVGNSKIELLYKFAQE
jgi:hypothetical protein